MPRLRLPLPSFAAPAFLLLMIPGVLAPLTHAQTAPSPDAPPVSTVPDAPEEEQPAATTLRVNVNLVSLFFTARDKHNGLVSTLTKKDCSILEDKQPQTIKNFSSEADLPLTLGILLDTLSTTMGQFGLLAMPVVIVTQLLSGSSTPMESMPIWLQYVMRTISPTPHFVSFAQAVLFRGADITLVWRPLVAMLIIGSVYFFFAMSRFRRVIFGS